jgi:GT2 family glycosyltransferase
MFLRRQKKRSSEPLVSVIVLSHNKAEVTRRCFHGLLESSYRPLEVLGIDNGSTDNTPDLYLSFASDAAEAGIVFRPIRCEENVGAATGRNLGLHEAQGHYIVFLDNDVVPRTRAWLERLRAVLDRDGSIGIVGPKLLYPTPPHDIQFAGAAVTPTGWVKYLGRGEPCDTEEFNAPRECQCLISACWMMPTELYHHIGGLDEGFNPVQFEDIDYCYRARHAGYRVRYEPSVEMYHFENVTSDGTSTINYPYVTVKNGMRFKRKWRFMFETEGGPSDDDLEWKSIERQPIEAIGPLEMVD